MSLSYNENDKMSELIAAQPELLQVTCRFGIQLGMGDKTVREVCEGVGVDVMTFLAVANFMRNGRTVAPFYIDRIDVKSMVSHLKAAHEFFISFRMVNIRRKLLEAIDCSPQNEVAFHILKFYDEYVEEVRKHTGYENRRVFTYVEGLLAGRCPEGESPLPYTLKDHEGMERKMQELKRVIVKYYTPADKTSNDLLAGVLYSICTCEADLKAHCEMEDALFLPAARLLEARVRENLQHVASEEETESPSATALSDREREVVACIVRGMTNKEVAERLFISVNTVLTHRKNIARKLDIHSTSALTIYAIVNGIVKLDEMN